MIGWLHMRWIEFQLWIGRDPDSVHGIEKHRPAIEERDRQLGGRLVGARAMWARAALAASICVVAILMVTHAVGGEFSLAPYCPRLAEEGTGRRLDCLGWGEQPCPAVIGRLMEGFAIRKSYRGNSENAREKGEPPSIARQRLFSLQ